MAMLYSHSRRLIASTTLCSRHHHHPLSSFISKPAHRYFSSNAFTSEQQQQQPKTSPKRKTRKTQRNTESIPSLSEFIHRSKVLKQYRSFIRLALFLDKRDNSNSNDDGTTATRRGECRAALEEVRVAYRLGVDKGRTDALARTMAFTEGERKLKELQSMVGIIPRKQTQSSSGSTNNDDEGSYDPDSWMNIKDDDDKRGRVGVQWPWQRSD